MNRPQKSVPAACPRLLGPAIALLTLGPAAAAQRLAEDSQPPVFVTAPIVVCFEEGSDPDYVSGVVDYVEQQNLIHHGVGYYLGSRWSGVQGSPRALTWSLVPDGLTIPGGVGEATSPSNLFASMDAKFAAQGGRATWLARLDACFARWEQLSGLSFTRVQSGANDWDDGAAWGASASGSRGDIRIAMHGIDGGNGILGYTQFPSGGDMVLDSAESFGSSSNLNRFLRNTVMHELGHAYGLSHVCSNNSTQLMEPFLTTAIDGPAHDDIRGIQRHYGDPFETDDSAIAATNLGTILSGVTLNSTCNVPPPTTGGVPSNSSICSLDGNAEADYWVFSTTAPSTVTVSVTPRGFTYDDTQQTQANPNCAQANNTTNSLTQANLNVQLLANNGSTVLGTAASAAAGQTEILAGVMLPIGTAYVRVYEGSSQTQSQLYTLSISVQTTCVGPPDCNLNGVTDSCDIAAGTSEDDNGDGEPDECQGFVGDPYCFGDHTDIFFTPCPCENPGAIGHGCANSVDFNGGLLEVSGTNNVIDVIALNASGMPATVSAIFLKGDSSNDNGITFGDGVRCADGNLIRLGTRMNVNGASSYPGPGQQIVSIRGQTPLGSGLTGYYTTYYRNAAAAWCPPATFNATNGFSLVW